MTPDQVRLVQTSFETIAPQADAVAEMFYDRLFSQHPEVRPLFGDDMRKQGAMLMQTLALAVRNLHQPEQIITAVQQLGRRHVGYGVQDAHYPMVGGALLWTLEQGLGKAFTPDMRHAWAAAYGTLASIMQDAARQARAA